MKGRKPVPAERKIAQGNPGHRPIQTVLVAGRLEEGEQLPSPPSMNAMEKRAWRDIQGALLAGGLDRADFAIVESTAVQLARAREARLDVHRLTSQRGKERASTLDVRRARSDERDAWKEFRLLAENLPLSPTGRGRLGMVRGGKVEGGMAGELGRTLPQRSRLRVVGDDAGGD
jgi:hypothetical protein